MNFKKINVQRRIFISHVRRAMILLANLNLGLEARD